MASRRPLPNSECEWSTETLGPDGTSTARSKGSIVGSSPLIRRAVSLIERLAATNLSILLVGATGTGKELFAQEIHRLSGRTGKLVDVNCGALPAELVEGELFGFRRGSFTGAVGESGGLVSEAGGGTLFLDELSTLPAPAQVKLLRVLETHQVRRVGDTTGRAVDFRVVGAVHEDLGLAVKRGEFRQDLFQRLAGLVISLPPLSERQEDIYPLAERFAAAMGRRLGPGVEAVLRRHRWVGNVRELRASIERSAFLSSAVELPPAVIAESIHLGSVPCAEELTLRLASERERLVQAMRESEGDTAEAAAKLGVSRSTVYRRLRAHGLAQPWISGAL